MIRGQTRAYYALLALTVLFSLLAVTTLLPSPGASKPNVLGYRSVCPYAPAATALCGLLAGATCTIRNRRFSRQVSSTRHQPPIAIALVVLGLGALTVVGAASYSQAQSAFRQVITQSGAAVPASGVVADGVRRATVSEGDVVATVEVTVVAGRIESLALQEARNVEDSVAGAIFDAVRRSQTTNVDAVSGATASSQVLLRAIEGALRGEP